MSILIVSGRLPGTGRATTGAGWASGISGGEDKRRDRGVVEADLAGWGDRRHREEKREALMMLFKMTSGETGCRGTSCSRAFSEGGVCCWGRKSSISYQSCWLWTTHWSSSRIPKNNRLEGPEIQKSLENKIWNSSTCRWLKPCDWVSSPQRRH